MKNLVGNEENPKEFSCPKFPEEVPQNLGVFGKAKKRANPDNSNEEINGAKHPKLDEKK